MQNLTQNDISILGRPLQLSPLDISTIKGITLGDRLSFNYFTGIHNEQKLAFATLRGSTPTPRSLAITAQNISNKLNMPLIFILPSCEAYLRQRLIDKGVYFVVSDKFAFLPNLIINENILRRKTAKRLSLVAQYILFYHLQLRSLNGLTAQHLKELMPYSYTSITLGLVCLEDLNLIVRKGDATRKKEIEFMSKGRDLFESARPFMINPVENRTYCDDFKSLKHFPTCGINALAHYTRLNPGTEHEIAISKQSFKELKEQKALIGENQYDGKYLIETWKYPPVTSEGFNGDWVDKLSLALSLNNDKDPRIENEVIRLIDTIEWSD